MSIQGLSDNAVKVLASLASQRPDPRGHSPAEVETGSTLHGLDFTLAVKELEDYQVSGFGVLFQINKGDDVGNLKLNPGGWELVKKHQDALRAVLEGGRTAVYNPNAS